MRGVLLLLLALLFPALGGCGVARPTPCDPFGDRKLAISGREYRNCAGEILAALDAVEPPLRAMVAGRATDEERDVARRSYRQLQLLIGRTGIKADYLSVRPLDGDMDTMRRLAFVESFLKRQLSVTDSEGRRTKTSLAFQEKLLYMGDPGPNWRDWALVFHVPDESRQLTLLIENPEPREGQAQRAAIDLGL